MAVTRQQLCQALDLVEAATSELVADRTFHHAVRTRLGQMERPADLNALAARVGKKAGTTKAPTSIKGMNGVTLDQRGKASLESLVLHYAKQSCSDNTQKALRTRWAKIPWALALSHKQREPASP